MSKTRRPNEKLIFYIRHECYLNHGRFALTTIITRGQQQEQRIVWYNKRDSPNPRVEGLIVMPLPLRITFMANYGCLCVGGGVHHDI